MNTAHIHGLCLPAIIIAMVVWMDRIAVYSVCVRIMLHDMYLMDDVYCMKHHCSV
jgi:hypothetical protein